jgi:hypothetical protein
MDHESAVNATFDIAMRVGMAGWVAMGCDYAFDVAGQPDLVWCLWPAIGHWSGISDSARKWLS